MDKNPVCPNLRFHFSLFFTDKLLNYRVLNGSVFLTSPEAKKRRESEPTKQ